MSVQGEVGNKFLTDDIIVKEALRLLKNNLIAAPLVYRDLERRFSKVGDVISLEKPYRTKTASGRVLQKQPLVDRKMPFKIDRQEHFGVEVTMRDRTLTIEKFSERYLRSGIIQIANKIDRSVLEALSHAYFSSSMSGSDLKVGDLARANAYMNMVAVPDDGGRRVILHELDSVGISEDIASSFNPGMVRTAIQRGYMGPVSNFDLFKSTNIPTHVVGNYGGTPLMDGDKQTGDVLHTKDWSTSVNGLLNENDVFTIGGVVAGIGGVLASQYFGYVSPMLGGSLLIFAFIVTVIGGLGSLAGAAVASVLVAVLQQFTNYYWGVGDFIVVLLLAVVLLARPQGLLGRKAA